MLAMTFDNDFKEVESMINLSRSERIVRILIGVAMIGMYLFVENGVRYIGLLGLIPMITGFIGNCPFYAVLGINANRGR